MHFIPIKFLFLSIFQLTDENASNNPSPVPVPKETVSKEENINKIETDSRKKLSLQSMDRTNTYSTEANLNKNNFEAYNLSSLNNQDQSITPVLSTTSDSITSESLPMQTNSFPEDLTTKSSSSSSSQPKLPITSTSMPVSSSSSSVEKESCPSSSSSVGMPSSSTESSPSKHKVASRKDIIEPSLASPSSPPTPQKELVVGSTETKTNKRESKKSKSKNKKAHKLSAEVGKPRTTMEMTDGDEQGMKNDTGRNANSNEDPASSAGSSPDSSDGSSSSASGSQQTDQAENAPSTSDVSPVIASSSAPSSVSTKKPIDLTVKCPPTGDDEKPPAMIALLTPEAHTSPSSPRDSLFTIYNAPNTEPSSPDSLNTTQSMAGSECGGCVENLSVSETELLMMNRTASIDEVEEDLPQEQTPSDWGSTEASGIISAGTVAAPELGVDFVDESSRLVKDMPLLSHEREEQAHFTNNPITSMGGDDDDDDECLPSMNVDSSYKPLPETNRESDAIQSNKTEEMVELREAEIVSSNISKECSLPVSSPGLDVDRNGEKEMIAVKEDGVQLNIETKDNGEEEEEGSGLAKHEEKSSLVTDSGQEKASTLSQEEPDPPPIPIVKSEMLQNPENERKPSSPSQGRPKSITMAVSEWLKTQGDDALTPILPSRSISTEEEFEGDIDEDSDTDAEEEENSNPTKSQNQKNEYGNPWVAPSNKSGSTSKGIKSRSKGNHRIINQEQQKDGTLNSRVALSSTSQLPESQVTDKKCTDAVKVSSGQKHTHHNHDDSGLELSSPESTTNSCSGGETDTATSKSNPPRKKVLRKSEERELSSNITIHTDLNEEDISDLKKSSSSAAASERSHSIISTTSLDESRDNAQICDPQRFAKYYQFGVVFDQRQGEEDTPEDGGSEEDESSFLEDITLADDVLDGNEGERKPSQPDFLQVMMNRNKTLRMKVLPLQQRRTEGKDVILRGYCDEDDDEEIGTYDPKISEMRLSEAVKSFRIQSGGDVTPPSLCHSTSSHHIYVNPMSLAKELVDSSASSGEPLSDSWDVDSEPLPPYEPPSPVEVPVYNHLTPEARLIRRKLHAVGDPVSSTICCSIQ
jgi:hypothetical protein